LLSNAALILAAGSGSRFCNKTPKQYHKLKDGKTILEHTIEKFRGVTDIICIVMNQEHKGFEFFSNSINVVGGKTRQESVRLGLESLQHHKPKNVLIHDGVRPFVSSEIISSVIRKLEEFEAVDVALPVTDTIKTYAGKTVDRDSIYATQTPQGFNFEVISSLHSEAFRGGRNDYTDDISLYLDSGRKNLGIVTGCPKNIKITYKSDLI
jgi:2-C-methyl-D-erythritol 4-phosphate cytidylyltransferase/2-C-methyl-D-erythritol 2,4-cyclodiphosphate synthase